MINTWTPITRLEKINIEQTLRYSCASLPLFPFLFFCHWYPSFRKNRCTLRLKRNQEPPVISVPSRLITPRAHIRLNRILYLASKKTKGWFYYSVASEGSCFGSRTARSSAICREPLWAWAIASSPPAADFVCRDLNWKNKMQQTRHQPAKI